MCMCLAASKAVRYTDYIVWFGVSKMRRANIYIIISPIPPRYLKMDLRRRFCRWNVSVNRDLIYIYTYTWLLLLVSIVQYYGSGY